MRKQDDDMTISRSFDQLDEGEDESLGEAALYQAAFDRAPLAMSLVRLDGRIERINERHAQLLGYSPEELVGREIVSFLDVDDQAAAVRARGELLAGQAAQATLLERLVRRDGTRVPTRRTCALLRDASGTPRGFVSQVVDLSEQMQLEARLRQAEKMEAVGQLAGGIAHDFNNLLTTIVANASLAMEETEGAAAASLGADRSVHESLREIRRAADRATALTRQLLAFSRQQVLRPQPVHLPTVVRAAMPLLRRLLREDIGLDARLADGLGHMVVDPVQVEQVLLNLVVNARDAILAHRAERRPPRTDDVAAGALAPADVITIATMDLRVRVPETMGDPMRAGDAVLLEALRPTGELASLPPSRPALPVGDYTVLAVNDTGPGMAAETQRHIFEPFFTTKGATGGTGLGLATVYGIVKQSDGFVYVDSAIGAGSTFSVYFPLRPDVVEPPMPGASEAPRETGRAVRSTAAGARVLVAEDQRGIRSVVARVLRRAGFEVVEAVNGVDALQRWEDEQGRFDLVLTDVVMPVLSGPALVERLRAQQPTLPVIFTSGYAEAGVLPEGPLPPGTRWLAKPFDAETLLIAVDEILAR